MQQDKATPAELKQARAQFPQVYDNLVHLGSEKGLYCAKCGTKAQPGGGHGDDFGFSFYYCYTCDEFVEWDSFGMTKDMTNQCQAWARPHLRGEAFGDCGN